MFTQCTYRTLVQATAKAMRNFRIACALVAAFGFVQVSLAQMIQIVSPSSGTVSSLHSQGVTAKGWVGFNTELWVNNQAAKKSIIRRDGIVDFINVDVPEGDVKLEARLVNSDGSVIEADSIRIHVLGAPSFIKMEVSEMEVRANNSTPVKARIQVFDSWGYALQDGIIVTVKTDSGTIAAQDLDPITPGTQLRIVNGYAEFEYIAGKTSGTATITAEVDRVKESVHINLKMPLEPLTVVGLVNGSAGFMSAGGDRTRLAGMSSFTDGMDLSGRAAVYARGTIGDDYLLTASYDSDRKNRSSYFRFLDPDYLYSIYGDNSMLSYDVQTQSPLYVKIEKNQSYALIGDFSTDLSSQEFTRYDRSLSGVKVAHQDSLWRIKAFGSLTDKQVKHVEIRGEGLCGFYNLGSTHITTGSEKISIEVRDKYHSEVIISSTDKSRFTDYDIDDDQGTLFFKESIPAFDANDNPVWIVATFEAVSDHASTYIAGASVERALADNLSIGLTGVTEEQSPTNYTLVGINSRYQIDSHIGLSGEFGHSSDFASTPGEKSSGNAYKMEMNLTPFTALSLKSYYRTMEEGFYNIRESGSRKERGTKKYGISGGYQFGGSTVVNAEYYQTLQNTDLGNTTLTSMSGSIKQQIIDRLSAQLQIQDLRYSQIDTSMETSQTHSTLATAGVTYVAADRLKLSASHDQNLSSGYDPTKPNATAMAADYRMTNDVSVSAEERFYDDGGNLATLSLNSFVTEHTQLYSKYEIGNSVSGRRNMVSVGLRHMVKLPFDLTGSLSYERAKDLSQRLDQTSTQDHDAYSVGLEYLPKAAYKAATHIEFGNSPTNNKMNFYFVGDCNFKKDFSFILKYTLSNDNVVGSTGSGYRDISHLITGVAYRPVTSNDFNAVGKIEIKEDNNHYVAPYLDDISFIGSVHTFIEPVKRVELGIKLAYKATTENSDLFSYSTHAMFYLLRGVYNITEKFDVAAEGRALVQVEAHDVLYGYSAEVGYAIVTNVRLGVGYNFKGYTDKDLVDNNLWSAGPFVHFSFKFGEDLFGK